MYSRITSCKIEFTLNYDLYCLNVVSKYSHELKKAEFLIKHKKDIPILAAVLYVRPDYFLTGDAHFFNDNIKSIANVVTAKDFFAKIK